MHSLWSMLLRICATVSSVYRVNPEQTFKPVRIQNVCLLMAPKTPYGDIYPKSPNVLAYSFEMN
jgi:hypothetical protein